MQLRSTVWNSDGPQLSSPFQQSGPQASTSCFKGKTNVPSFLMALESLRLRADPHSEHSCSHRVYILLV